LRVTCPHCDAALEISGESSTVMCNVCLRKFNAKERKTVTCQRCGAELTVPARARVIRCGGCGERIELVPQSAPRRDSSEFVTETSIILEGPPRHSDMLQETSMLSSPGALGQQRLDGMRGEFDEKYEVLEPLGHGGMGAIYKARQKRPPRIVVLKVMLNGKFASEKYRLRFEREAQAVARLKHPNIVAVYEFGEVKGQPYFTMEYVEGCSVKEYVIRHRLEKRPICELMLKICKAVAYAHQRGVIHRDLKPNNILVDGQGNPRLLDFGLARMAGDYTEESPQMSEAGEVMGTPSYMSPEQTLGRPEEIDIRTDVYSIGVLFYELLTDTLPYRIDRSRPLESLRKIRDYVPRRPSDINPKIDGDLDAIVMKCLEKERELRFQSAVELSEDISRYLRGKPVEARPSNTFYRFRKLLWRHRSVFLPILGALLVVVAMTAVFVWSLAAAGDHARQAVAEAERTAERLRESQFELKQFICDLEGVRTKVESLLMAGRWEEAYSMAAFAEEKLGAGLGYEGYCAEVRQDINRAATSEAEKIQKLVDQLRFRDARAKLQELRGLAVQLDLQQLAVTLDETGRGFDDACWESLSKHMQQKGSASALQRFLAECPNSPHARAAQELLDKIRHRLRFSQWPFSPDDAVGRQAMTAELLDIPARRKLQLDAEAALSLVLIPAGEFVMGCSREGPGFNSDQRPAHRVRVMNPFYMAATEVTREQFTAVTGRVLAGSAGQGNAAASMPACVSWEEAQSFCTALSRDTQLTVRLPTEAEWEYACRAGSDALYSHGDDPDLTELPEYGWYRDTSERQPHPVALKRPSAWGLYDMHGNMLEWCRDWYDARYYLQSPVQDPHGPESGTYRALRGGSWAHGPEELRCATRDAAQPDSFSTTYGFRVVVEVFAEVPESPRSSRTLSLITP